MQCYMMFYIRSVRVYGELLHVDLHWQTSAQEYSLIVNISGRMTGLRSRLRDHISYVLLYYCLPKYAAVSLIVPLPWQQMKPS